MSEWKRVSNMCVSYIRIKYKIIWTSNNVMSVLVSERAQLFNICTMHEYTHTFNDGAVRICMNNAQVHNIAAAKMSLWFHVNGRKWAIQCDFVVLFYFTWSSVWLCSVINVTQFMKEKRNGTLWIVCAMFVSSALYIYINII